MKFRFAFLTLLICALTTLGFKAYTHWAADPGITDIAGNRSVTHQKAEPDKNNASKNAQLTTDSPPQKYQSSSVMLSHAFFRCRDVNAQSPIHQELLQER